jgi:hypothetical protein
LRSSSRPTSQSFRLASLDRHSEEGGVGEYMVLPFASVNPAAPGASITWNVGPFSLIQGHTAWVGIKYCVVKEGNTVVVSGAHGAVGSLGWSARKSEGRLPSRHRRWHRKVQRSCRRFRIRSMVSITRVRRALSMVSSACAPGESTPISITMAYPTPTGEGEGVVVIFVVVLIVHVVVHPAPRRCRPPVAVAVAVAVESSSSRGAQSTVVVPSSPSSTSSLSLSRVRHRRAVADDDDGGGGTCASSSLPATAGPETTRRGGTMQHPRPPPPG